MLIGIKQLDHNVIEFGYVIILLLLKRQVNMIDYFLTEMVHAYFLKKKSDILTSIQYLKINEMH